MIAISGGCARNTPSTTKEATGGRRARLRGVVKVAADFALLAAAVNLARPRHWLGLLRQSKATLASMEDQLIRAGVFKLEGRGMVAIGRQAIAGLQTRARQILSGEAGDGGTGILDAALVAVASVIPLRTLFDRCRKRQDRQRVDALTRLVSISAPGFEATRADAATRGRSYSAGDQFTDPARERHTALSSPGQGASSFVSLD